MNDVHETDSKITKHLPTASKALCEETYLVGIDVGSTTVKLVALKSRSHEVAWRAYRRHGAQQVKSALDLIDDFCKALPHARMCVAVTGSGGSGIAQALNAVYIQEVIANATALRALYPQVRTAIELGGQDAKVVFFSFNEQTDSLDVDDMRMNGTCAGGTGAFLDEIATLLNVPIEDFNALAQEGDTVYPVSGRCGVFAKTDMQPLINQGVAKANLALSTFHAIAKQTIGGLAQGRNIVAPVVFGGGPLLFNPRLVQVFRERLGLSEQDAIVPEHSETMVAYGAALYAETAEGVRVQDAAEAKAALLALANAAHDQYCEAPLFASQEEKDCFYARHAKCVDDYSPVPNLEQVFLGIDSGSTTTKIALVDATGRVLDAQYASNEGEPLEVARRMLVNMHKRWSDAHVNIPLRAVGVTGYGEMMFAEAYQADSHVVETVAHARAALANHPEATFVLDIGGQDMKALWLDNGVITNVIVNEACSSGCGSFLEGFAASLGIPRKNMAEEAFASANPANLGSRCTVFMESSVITEQRNGKTPQDIMAGLSRSIVDNVLTKVIRSSNLDSLGEHVVVQGGTFANDAVLRAFEERLGRNVVRAEHPELAGAIGAALVAADRVRDGEATSFIGFDAVASLEWKREQNVACPYCANHCLRTIIRFSSGSSYVTGNRCPRGEQLPNDNTEKQTTLRALAPNVFRDREQLLFKDYLDKAILPENGISIGLPRILSMWDDAPFWKTFFQALGFSVRFSRPSSRERYEAALQSVASDTACFPAKLAHSHVKDLAEQKVDRIFMPILTARKPEGDEPHSESVCALVKGIPMVIRSSDNPSEQWGIAFDTPLFHWHSENDRLSQLCTYMKQTFDIDERFVRAALQKADAAKAQFKCELQHRGSEVLERVRAEGGFALVLACRPYHNDALVNHGLPEMLASLQVAVLPPDALPGLDDISLDECRLDIVNNYHARMLRSALYAARSDCLEYIQLVSFGCGHDAYLSDEIIRLMKQESGKAPLIVKLDEGDVQGPLAIRVRSFLETVSARRKTSQCAQSPIAQNPCAQSPCARDSDPYAVKYTEKDRQEKIALVPNTSHAFSRLMAVVYKKQGIRIESLPVGHERASELGKKYVHNDICYPAQMVIGEALEALESGKYDPNKTAITMAKYLGDCRLTHYSALLRKALDEAGYKQVPIITNDIDDEKNMHPGFKMNLLSSLRIAFGLPMIDALEELLRKMRPYEIEKGASDEAFDRALDAVIDGFAKKGIRGARKGFEQAIRIMKDVVYDRTKTRPRVLIVGEYLLNFHEGANRNIERYLENNGMEVVEARMTDVIRKTYFYQRAQVKEFGVQKPFSQRAFLELTNSAFEAAHNLCDRIACAHPLYEPPCRMPELVKASDPIVHHSFDAGEGVLIPAEILHHYAQGLRSFIILQPFGCLPNHIVGRGIVKSIREACPNAHVLALDFDPDTSFANIENRLQMLIMGSAQREAQV